MSVQEHQDKQKPPRKFTFWPPWAIFSRGKIKSPRPVADLPEMAEVIVRAFAHITSGTWKVYDNGWLMIQISRHTQELNIVDVEGDILYRRDDVGNVLVCQQHNRHFGLLNELYLKALRELGEKG